MGNLAAENGLEIGKDIDLHDSGDLPLLEAEGDDTLIEQAFYAAAIAGEQVMALGGDHSITYPIVKALSAVHGPLTILHFDAHPDLYDLFDENPRSHASPFARIMEGGHARRLVQIGIRTLNDHQRTQAGRFGVEIVPARGYLPADLMPLEGPLYISVDLDAIDPAFAPGVSHIEPGGLTVREILDTLDRQRAPIVGADVVELNPTRDLNDITACVASKITKELMARMTINHLP